MTRKYRHMPRNEQIKLIRRIVEQLNPHLSDPDTVPRPDGGYESWEDCVDDASFEENRAYLEERYPHIRWRAPKKEPSIEREQREWMLNINREDKVIEYSKDITIRTHKVKSKGKTYEHGRIQLTAPKKWIGRKVKVSISVPYGLALKADDIYFQF